MRVHNLIVFRLHRFHTNYILQMYFSTTRIKTKLFIFVFKYVLQE